MHDRQEDLEYRTTFYPLEHFYREGFTVGYFTCIHALTLVRVPENACDLVLWQTLTNASYEYHPNVFDYIKYYHHDALKMYYWHVEDFTWKEAQDFCRTKYPNGNLVSIINYDLLQLLTMRCVIKPSYSIFHESRKERCLTPVIFIGLQMEVKRCSSEVIFVFKKQ